MTYAMLADLGRHYLIHDTEEMRADFHRWLIVELLRRGNRNVETMTLWELTELCEVEAGERIARAA